MDFSVGRPPTVIDLFCGAGGFSLGFQAAGFRIVAAVDVDEAAARTFGDNFGRIQSEAPPRILAGDDGNLEDIDLGSIASTGEIDVLIGGPPCQGFSRLGRAKLDSLTEEGFEGDPRNAFYRRFLDAARLWAPRAVVMENVPGMLSVGGVNLADAAAEELAGCGYQVIYGALNAVWYGVPQFRERLIFIGFKDGLGIPSLPRATHRAVLPAGYAQGGGGFDLVLPFIKHHQATVSLADARVLATTVREAIGDLPSITTHLEAGQQGDPLGTSMPGKKSLSAYAALMRDWPDLLRAAEASNHIIRKTPRDYPIFRLMKPGDRYPEALAIARRLLDEERSRLASTGESPPEGSAAESELQRRFIPPYPVNIFVDKWRKLLPDRPAWTVPAHLSKDAYSHIHYDEHQARAISVREAARLQSFPDAYVFSGSMGDTFRQVGNAVPPLMAWAIARSVMDTLGLPSRRPDRLLM